MKIIRPKNDQNQFLARRRTDIMTPMLLEDDGDSMLTLLLTRLTRRHFLAKSAVFAPVQLCKSLYYLHLCSVQVSTICTGLLCKTLCPLISMSEPHSLYMALHITNDTGQGNREASPDPPCGKTDCPAKCFSQLKTEQGQGDPILARKLPFG